MRQFKFSELALVFCFLAVIASVPVAQTCIELARGERVQFMDVFRYEPSAKNLRQFERTLEEKSWFQQNLRPKTQKFMFDCVRDTGAKGILGRDRWLFYRPDVRYLVEPDRIESGPGDSKWVEARKPQTVHESVEQAIIRFRDQLKERGITLIVMPVPGKPAIYPDQLTRHAADANAPTIPSPTQDLIRHLRQKGIAAVDLFSLFTRARCEGRSLYLARDTHWTPEGAELAAQAIAGQLRALQLAPEPKSEFRVQTVEVRRWGDILDMMQIPGLREEFQAERVQCKQVLDPALGLLVPSASDRPGTYRYPGQKASVLLLGDSFSRIYQIPEPRTLGDAPKTNSQTKCLLPGSAGLISQLALALKSPVDAIVSDGGAATDVRRKLSTHPEILEGKKVVIWEFVERDIALGAQGWQDVPLPTKLD